MFLTIVVTFWATQAGLGWAKHTYKDEAYSGLDHDTQSGSTQCSTLTRTYLTTYMTTLITTTTSTETDKSRPIDTAQVAQGHPGHRK